MSLANELANVVPPTLTNLNQATLAASTGDATEVDVGRDHPRAISVKVDTDGFVVFGLETDAAPTDVTATNGYPLTAGTREDFYLPKNIKNMWIQSGGSAGNFFWWFSS